ncbi:HNH endonuclease signature motif containing protein [Microbacterium aoyamense]|uniref:HNH endonuclease signature motif containing protein n=1 Tax=Microbacterium aoyamense TaxID=344166 RepID=A0ABP5AFJ3_9MICO|nr:HNH endonuclease signature motif containing protein [Microbacterium aoyamense]
MNELLARLATLKELAAEVAASSIHRHEMRVLDEHEVVAVLASAAHVQRLLDAVVIEAVGEVVERTDEPVTEGRMTHRFGCRNVSELVQRATLVSPVTAARFEKAAKAVRRGVSFTGGELLEARLPALRDALGDGVVGLDGALAIAAPLMAMGARASRDAVLIADAELAAGARGEGVDAAPPACADLLRVQSQVWAAALDPDGAEPRERAAIHKRAFQLGAATDHGVPVRGMLMPEVAAQFQRICDATLSPRVEGVQFLDSESLDAEVPVDPRTQGQKQHDVLAMALGVAASSELLPTIGGAAPTLVVTVREEDLASGKGSAHVEGTTEPVAIASAQHVACSGAVQRIVFDNAGRIVALGTEERVFNRRQRRAIAARDGGCVIPGCGVPAGWCEVHHVTEHARGGPTHTDNGVLLCWHHHRFLDSSGWMLRMNRGVPEVRAPLWHDSSLRWRPVTTSKTRLLNAVLKT